MYAFPHHPNLTVALQPIVPLFPINRRRPIVSAEALLRSVVPGGRAGSSYRVPFQLLRKLQDTDNYAELLAITKGILQTACVHAWRAHQMGAPISVSVNVPPMLFGEALIGCVVATLNQMNTPPYSFLPSSLSLEITEETKGSTPDILNAMEVLHTLGVHISVDDVGVGGGRWVALINSRYVSTIKIDRSWVVDASGRHRSIFLQTLTLALRRRIQVVLEGVETPHDLESMMDLFYDVPNHRDIMVQGFVFYQPLLGDNFQLAVADSLFRYKRKRR